MQMYDRADSMTSDEESEKLQLYVSCRNLADLDFITVTDSFLIVTITEPNKPPKQIIRTKVYQNDLNPDYAETAVIDYFFQIRQKLTFDVYHQEQPPKLVGRTQTSVGEVFGSPSNGLKRPLMNQKGKESGRIIIRVQKIFKMANQIVDMQISARGLPNLTFLCFFGGTYPFFRIYRKRQTDELMIYQSQVASKTQNPTWKPIRMSQRKLCRNNQQHPFEIKFLNYSESGAHSIIGQCSIRLFELRQTYMFPIKKSLKNNGICHITNVKRAVKHQFGDYISANLQLALINCVDFTASNGSLKAPTSLHYITENKMSEYECALLQVSKILLDYDYDKLVPLYGFGAKVNMPTFQTYNKVHHCFPLNGNENDANVFHIEGIMKSYRSCLPFLEFGGPTKFSPLLGNAIQQCKTFQQTHNQYMVLFILTDGQIHDRQEVINQIVACGKLPISLIIVGVGNGDFTSMHILDDDNCQLRDSYGNKTVRDLVQFVEFRKFQNNSVELAKQVLEELPRQVEDYFQLMGLGPQNISGAMKNTEIQNMFMQRVQQGLKQGINGQNPYQI